MHLGGFWGISRARRGFNTETTKSTEKTEDVEMGNDEWTMVNVSGAAIGGEQPRALQTGAVRPVDGGLPRDGKPGDGVRERILARADSRTRSDHRARRRQTMWQLRAPRGNERFQWEAGAKTGAGRAGHGGA